MFTALDTTDERTFKALTGLTHAAFEALLVHFATSYAETIKDQYDKNKAKRKRQPGGGRKGRLNSLKKKLFFVLYYLKTYPTFDVLGDHFGMDRSKACTNLHRLFSILLRALKQADVLPERHFTSPEEIQAAFAGILELFIDATERPQQRPQDGEAQSKKYSGKRKRHMVKNTVISSAAKQILFLGYTVFGSEHDYSLLKTEFDPKTDWFATFKLWVDLGYLGIKTDYKALEIHIPHKTPRKSEANPEPSLSPEQKMDNRAVSQMRIVVENAICRMKRFRGVTDVFRNRKNNFVDDIALAAAGLANWLLAQQTEAAAA